MQLLRTVAIIFIIFYGFRLLSRYVFPFLLKRWMNKKMGQFQQQANQQFKNRQQAQQFAKEQEGKVKIKSRKKSQQNESDGLGEFVDYEEVE